MSRKLICLVVVLLNTIPAMALIVDGNLSDWGVNVADQNQSTFNFAVNIGLLGSHVEDQDDLAGDSGYLGPNIGGQNFDAEMMAVALTGGRFYISIVTGQRPDNGLARYNPGDLIITTAGGTFGLEVGGGAGGGAGSAIAAGATGSTYTLNSSGFTTAHANANAQQTAGSIWGNVDWLLDPISPKVPVQFAINGGSTFVGLADYIYTRNTVTSQHAIIELSFPAAWFAGNSIESFTWRPSCGNDELQVMVPEPASLGLMLLGVAAVVRSNRRRSIAN